MTRERVHMAGYDPYPFERSGTPDIWGHGLRHQVIAGTDADADEGFDALRGTPLADAVSTFAFPVGGLAVGAFLFAKGHKKLGAVALLLGAVSGVKEIMHRNPTAPPPPPTTTTTK